ncbi:hypothetical protein PV325_013965 [Microctonus aethiopoides]|nr:hypothetical protein PV325_013965 [Microctonus aethiopoides]
MYVLSKRISVCTEGFAEKTYRWVLRLATIFLVELGTMPNPHIAIQKEKNKVKEIRWKYYATVVKGLCIKRIFAAMKEAMWTYKEISASLFSVDISLFCI